MATVAARRRWYVTQDARFFLICAGLMWLVLALGFGSAFALGRSSFGAPALVHLHAFVFVSWTALYVAQTALAATGNYALHRRVGWVAVWWLPTMVVMGTWITIWSIRHDRAPFFFEAAQFLVADPLAVLTFALLSGAGIALRRKTQWHRRLMLSGMAVLTGPGFGRFVPVALLVPHTADALIVLILLFPVAGVIRDWRVAGKVHPAWWVGIGAILTMHLLNTLLPRTAAVQSLYWTVVAGTPGAATAPLDFPPFPPGFPVKHP